jgi:gamma-glutamyltranspeptidase
MDAAAAACLVSCMLEPQAVDLGGYVACAVVLDSKTGRVWAIDANCTAPARATPNMYQVLPTGSGANFRGPISLNESEYGCSVKNNANVDGAMAVSVPGTLAGIGTLWERWGKLTWAQIVAPAQDTLERGFPVDPALAQAVQERSHVLSSMVSAAAHFMPDGRPLQPGQVWHRPGMDWTLRRIASAGWQDFYRGEIARRIARYVESLGGILSLTDLREYRPHCTPAIEISCAGSRIYGAPLANGGLTPLSGLLLLDQVAAPDPDDPMYSQPPFPASKTGTEQGSRTL